MDGNKINERVFTGHLVNWIDEAIRDGKTVFQYVTNDESLKLDSGVTLYPDILLFTNKTSGEVFNGWELKLPDTAVDDEAMLLNALEKAKKLHSDSFVTWNCADSIIWKINDGNYTLDGLSILKRYSTIPTILNRNDISNSSKYLQHESELKERAVEILYDLDELFRNGTLKPAADVSNTIIEAVINAYNKVVPQFEEAIKREKADNPLFRKEFNRWKVYESAMLKVLETSSRRAENVVPERVLAMLTFYNLAGKIIFYFNLCDNLHGELKDIELSANTNVKEALDYFFEDAKRIDYHAIFQPYFTDGIVYSDVASRAIYKMVKSFSEFDFRNLPSEVIGYVLENIVSKEEKQKLGQYFTNEILANIVAFPAVQTEHSVLFDPTSGSGTFLTAFYNILKYYNENKSHTEILNQVWGNDVSHFPAILSVINLYKQDVSNVANFPRVMRNDFFNIEVGDVVEFPDSKDYHRHYEVVIPAFNGIASNFPFIQQEDNPSEIMCDFFKEKFEDKQRAFLKGNDFEINERSDYFTYCVYNSYRFLSDGGVLSVITSNAWLGKEYGLQFKRFLLDNFHIKYVVRSEAEHWFKDSHVSTVFLVLEKNMSDEPTRFVTFKFKLADYFCTDNTHRQIEQIENLYTSIDFCDDIHSQDWHKDANFPDCYKRVDGNLSVCVIQKKVLLESLANEDNWIKYFTSSHIFDPFENSLIDYTSDVFVPFRGERTGWDSMFIIPSSKIRASKIASDYLAPFVKSSTELSKVTFDEDFEYKLFVCNDDFENLDYGTRSWISKYQNQLNKNKTQTIEMACKAHKPYWYSLKPKVAEIITSINPYERFFFTYLHEPVAIGQRLIALNVNKKYDIELIAALLNSVVVFLEIELKGTGRSLGVLDLNANYLKKLRYLNPDILCRMRTKETFFPNSKLLKVVMFFLLKMRCYDKTELLLMRLY